MVCFDHSTCCAPTIAAVPIDCTIADSSIVTTVLTSASLLIWLQFCPESIVRSPQSPHPCPCPATVLSQFPTAWWDLCSCQVKWPQVVNPCARPGLVTSLPKLWTPSKPLRSSRTASWRSFDRRYARARSRRQQQCSSVSETINRTPSRRRVMRNRHRSIPTSRPWLKHKWSWTTIPRPKAPRQP